MKGNIKRILAINFGGLGDQVLFLPALKTLKQHYLNAQITFVTESRSQSIKELTDLIDNIITCDIKTKNKYTELLKLLAHTRLNKYDLVISSGSSSFISIILFLTGIKKRVGYNTGKISNLLLTQTASLNENQYAACMYHDLVSYIDSNTFCQIPSISINSNSLTKMKQLITKDDKINVLIHPGVSNLSIQKNIIKFWSPDKWTKLVDELISSDYRVVLSGGPDDKETIQLIKSNLKNEIDNKNKIIDISNKTKNIQEFAAAVSLSDIITCVDSAPMHIAVGLNKKTVALFGPTDENKLLPKTDNFTPIKRQDIMCRPCLWQQRQTSCDKPACMDIFVENVLTGLTQNKILK